MPQTNQYVTYVENSPENIRGVLCENVNVEDGDVVHRIRVYRPVSDRLPIVTSADVRRRYAVITYDDGCICYSYETDNPIRAHTRLERYSPDDLFKL